MTADYRPAYPSPAHLVIFDADGTLIDAFTAIDKAFSLHGLNLGDLARFQKRHNMFKYLGGLKEFPRNLSLQIGKRQRRELITTMTGIYREEAQLFPGMGKLLRRLIDHQDVRVALVTRNITHDPEQTLSALLARHDIDIREIDHWAHVPLSDTKTAAFRAARERFGINPARCLVLGDEHKDYAAAQAAGMQAMIAAYGFDSLERLTGKYEIPPEIIAATPEELIARLQHALGLHGR